MVAEKQATRRMRVAFQQGRKKRDYGDASWDEDMRRFALQLRPHGLFIRDVAGDGNCLFRSLADQLGLGAASHAEVRERVVDFIVANRADFEPFVEDDVPFDGYVARMRKERAWGGQLELQAASLLFRVNVLIHQLDMPRWDIVNFTDGARSIQLAYHDGDHYNSVRPVADATPHEAAKIPQLNEEQTAIVLAAAAAAAPSQQQQETPPMTKKERIVMESTGEKDIEKVKAALARNRDNIDAAISDLVVAAQQEAQADEEVREALRLVEQAEREQREKEREQKAREEKEKQDKADKVK
jgi:OTU domain-containing protein 3